MKRWLLVVAWLSWLPAASAQWTELSFVDPGLRWRTLETAAFAVHFADHNRDQARLVAGAAERILPRITSLLRWRPASRIHLVVLNSADFANGLASPVPFNYTMVFLTPPDEGELLQNREWLDLVLTHELFHLVHLDKARGAPLGLRNVFGRIPFFFPNALQPGWIIEGLAVHAESDAGRSFGRLGNTQFEGMMRAEASRGFRSLAEINAGGRGFPLNREYLYGGYFFTFLQELYGARAVIDFIDSYSDNIIPFRVHSNPLTVTRKNMDDLWAEYHRWLVARFAKLRPPPAEGEVIARDWSLSSPALSPDGSRWYIRADGYTRPQLMRQAPAGKPEALRGVEQDARLTLSANGSALLVQPEICRNYNYYYDVHRVAPDGGLKRLSNCGRFRLAAPMDDGRVVGIRNEAGQAQAVTLDGEVLYRAAPGEALTGVATKGAKVVITSLRDERWSLLSIAAGKSQVLVSDSAAKHSPRIGERDEVFFIADYGKVYNVWSLRDGQLLRWTEAAHGVREISAPQRGEILLTTIEADGDALRLFRLPDQPLEQRPAHAAEQAAPAAMPSVSVSDRRYSPLSSLLPRSWLPMVEIAEGMVALGAATFGQDALAVHQYAVGAMYEFTQNELLGNLGYLYDGRHGLWVDRSMTVKETVGNEEEIAAYEISEGVQWVSTWRHLALNRRLYWGLGGALEREKHYRIGTPTATQQDERVLGLVAGLDTRRTFWMSEGPSTGFQLRLFAETSHGLHGAYSGDVYRVDGRLHLPLGRTVLSLRWNEAWGESDAEPFQLGGSRSDPAFLLPILNQREFPLRGYTSGEETLLGNRARVTSAELRIPLKDVDLHAMVPPVGLNRLALNLFMDVGDAWARDADPDWHRGYGIELMAEVRFGYLLGSHLRIGIADGRDEGGKTTAYLRVGRAF